jgi:hypothetical protein
MSILRFRITFDDYDDIVRDIDFKADQTFADLYVEILKSVGFDARHKGVFYLADHNWRKGAMIGEMHGEQDSKLKKTDLVDHIDDPHQKFLFSYDEEAKWNFNIELIRVMADAEYKVTYPKLAASSGIPPVQYKETLIIPTREKTEPDGRGRKPKAKVEEDDDALSALLASMGQDDEEEEEDGLLADDAEVAEAEVDALELPADLELETDSEIAKLAEEFNNTIDTSGSSSAESEDEDYSGFGGDDSEDDEFGSQDDDEFGGGGYGSYGGRGDDYD